MDRKGGARSGASASRRTPVQAPGGGGTPWMPIAIAGGVLAVVALIVYLIFATISDDGESLSASERAEQDDSASLPGEFFPSQGRSHFDYAFSQEREPRPFCEGVEHSEEADSGSSAGDETPAATSTPEPEDTPAADETPNTTPTVPTDCYASNPPSSGDHLGVQASVEVSEGIILPRIPPDPNVYPPDVLVPREAVPHILEHAGVFIGYNCADGDQACLDVVGELEDLVNDRIDNHDDRVVMASYADLPEGTVAAAAWTRVLSMPYEEFDRDAFEDFIGTHSCRYDPEGFC